MSNLKFSLVEKETVTRLTETGLNNLSLMPCYKIFEVYGTLEYKRLAFNNAPKTTELKASATFKLMLG